MSSQDAAEKSKSKDLSGAGQKLLAFASLIALIVGVLVVVQAQYWLTRLGQSGMIGPILTAVVLRELGAGVLNGLALAVILGVGAMLILGDPWMGLVLGLAMICNQIVAALGGVLVPLTMNRLGLDPALASGTFVTTLTDVMGFLAFLGFATLLLL
jgi:magnesium transporter